MYEPVHFREERLDVLHGLIEAFPLGLLVSNGPDGSAPVGDLVPFLVDRGIGQYGRLRAHLARANPHLAQFSAQPQSSVLAVFQGPSAYVTPAWYETKRETGKVVPTWNYVTVQVEGLVTVHDDPAWLRTQIGELTNRHEAGRADAWAVEDAPETYIAAQMRAIVGLELHITAISGKWKVSQNRNAADRTGVAAGFSVDDSQRDAKAMADLVKSRG